MALTSAIRTRYLSRTARRDTLPNSRKLTPTEKEIIIEYIIDLDSQTLPSRLKNVKNMANIFLNQRNARRVAIN